MIVHFAASRTRDDVKVAREEKPKFEAVYVAEGGRRRDEVGEFTKQPRQKVSSSAAVSKELAAVHGELE